MSSPIMPTRILIVGSGGREHALAWKLAGEPGVNAVYVAPGNDGIALEPRVACVPGVNPLDASALIALARREAVELVVIGPEAPLAACVADALAEAGIAVFGPSAAAARIETSKAFCREIAQSAGVPMARGQAFTNSAGARAFAHKLQRTSVTPGCVVKQDGLAAGKGVTVCGTVDEADAAITNALEQGTTVIVEERLVGAEASLIALTDGAALVALPPARDHKRLPDGDRGPNTGGMGAFSPLSDMADEGAARLLREFHRPILRELARRRTPFLGALYAGLMLTRDGPKLLECNARFGDPETQAILPRLAVALGPLLLAAARGRLRDQVDRLGSDLLPVAPAASVAVVLAAAGYPSSPQRGDPIEGMDVAARQALVFHAGTRRGPDGRFVTNGGRVLTVVGRGADVSAAAAAAQDAAEAIHFDGVQVRHDIGIAIPGALRLTQATAS